MSFDEDLQTYAGRRCNLRCIDKDEMKPATLQRIESINGVFMRGLISAVSNASNFQFTFADLLEKFGDKRIDILKMDIEQAEFLIEDQLTAVPICQILVEVREPLFLFRLYSRTFLEYSRIFENLLDDSLKNDKNILDFFRIFDKIILECYGILWNALNID